MKIFNVIRSKWMRRACPSKPWLRRISGLLATLMLFMSFAGQASAIILFQDDDSHDIDSEALTINANDGGDEDAVPDKILHIGKCSGIIAPFQWPGGGPERVVELVRIFERGHQQKDKREKRQKKDQYQRRPPDQSCRSNTFFMG